jgi:phospholipid/cholesterol/gamma-HCH transport system substrate-binding protein
MAGDPIDTPLGEDREPTQDRWTAPRVLVLLAGTIAVIAVAAVALFGSARTYSVSARFVNAGQLVKGNPVHTGGVPIGSVAGIEITPDGQADVELEIEDDFAPLRQGTRARIKQLSLSGIANRYVELTLPPAGGAEIADGGRIGTDRTTTAVDLDELFNTLDPKTRKALQGFFKGSANQFRGRGEQARVGFRYLNPALATSSRLFGELTRDQPVLERFLVDSSRLVTALADRRDDLAALIGNLNETTRALGSEKAALAESIGRLPPFMRRANTTFVNLRATLDDLDPLVDASKPVATALGPFLEEARGFARGARPTVRDLSRTVRRPGRHNDLVELMRSLPPLADIALVRKERFVSPGGRRVGVGEVDGAFPETVRALDQGTPEIGLGRAYATDFLGWFDDFSTTGPGFDALGSVARFHASIAENLPLPRPGPVRQGQYHRCPGSAEAPAPDGSNVLSAEEMEELRCEESDRATGDVE